MNIENLDSFVYGMFDNSSLYDNVCHTKWNIKMECPWATNSL